ncbi:hypothetical protein ACM2VE_24940, partial [Escherichia coli]
PKTSIICSPMTSLKTSIKTITYLSDIGCLEIQGASLSTLRRVSLEIELLLSSIHKKTFIIKIIPPILTISQSLP